MSVFSFSLCSGSDGNSTFIGTESARLVVDCGMNGRAFADALSRYGVQASGLDAILLTHEHVDHCSGLGVVMRRHRLPLFTTERTYLAARPALGKIDESLVHIIAPGTSFSVRDTEIIPFSTPHDAEDPVGFRVKCASGDVGVCTDLGFFSKEARTALAGCRVVYLESNYDVGMLETGPYPRFLKKRIAGRNGHLSNDDAGCAASWLIRHGTEALSLSHLSQQNNRPGCALVTVTGALEKDGIRAGRDYVIQASPRHQCSSRFVIGNQADGGERSRFQMSLCGFSGFLRCETSGMTAPEQISFLQKGCHDDLL